MRACAGSAMAGEGVRSPNLLPALINRRRRCGSGCPANSGAEPSCARLRSGGSFIRFAYFSGLRIAAEAAARIAAVLAVVAVGAGVFRGGAGRPIRNENPAADSVYSHQRHIRTSLRPRSLSITRQMIRPCPRVATPVRPFLHGGPAPDGPGQSPPASSDLLPGSTSPAAERSQPLRICRAHPSNQAPHI